MSALIQPRRPKTHPDIFYRTPFIAIRLCSNLGVFLDGERSLLEYHAWRGDQIRGGVNNVADMVKLYIFREVAHCPGHRVKPGSLICPLPPRDRTEEECSANRIILTTNRRIGLRMTFPLAWTRIGHFLDHWYLYDGLIGAVPARVAIPA